MQSPPWDLRSDTSRETGWRAQSTAADLVSPKLSYELFQQNGFHLLCEIANLDCKIHCAHPARGPQKEDANIAMQQRGKTREKCKAREGEKFSQPRTHEPCEPLRMRESASPRSGGLSHRRPSCNATRMPGLRIPLACSCRSHCSTTD